MIGIVRTIMLHHAAKSKRFKMKITLIQKFVDQCAERAISYGSTPEKVMCEIYEDYMINSGAWSDYDGWAVDAVCPRLGNVDVKMLEPGDKPWWSIPVTKGRNIFRQYGIIDNYMFVRADKHMSEYKVGDEVSIEIIGTMTYKEVCKNIQVSQTHGYYVDTRRANPI